MRESTTERFWMHEAASLARRVNLGWWADRFNLVAVILLLVLAVACVAVRTFVPDWLTDRVIWGSFGGALVASALLAVFWSRSRWIDSGEGLVHLDSRLGLENRLVTAHAGRGEWPARPGRSGTTSARPRWRWSLLLLPFLVASGLYALGALVPISRPEPPPALVASEPDAWRKMDEWLDTLEEEELIREEVRGEDEEKVESLRSRDEDEWFLDSSLEATDTLEENLGLGIREVADTLADLERDLERLADAGEKGDPVAGERARENLRSGLESLTTNDLSAGSRLSEEMAERLSGESGKPLALTPEQLEGMRRQLQEGSEALGSLEGLPEWSGAGQLLAEEGQPIPFPGQGGIQRGPGEAPLSLGEAREAPGGRAEGIEGAQNEAPRIGDLVGTGEADYDEELGAEPRRLGGAISDAGSGGEAVWRESFLPDEQVVLKRYFRGSGTAPKKD